MATNTSKTTNELKGGDQPLYQPWDDFSGKPQLHQSEDDIHDNSAADTKGNYDNGSGFYNNPRAQSATNTLRNAENNALSNREEQSSLYTGQGRNSDNNVKAKGGKKKVGALITVLLILAGGGAFLGSSNSLLLDAVNTLFTEATDYQYAGFSRRLLKLVGFNMNSDDITVKNWKGVTTYKKMSSSFEQQLANAGFTFEGSGGKKTMTWTYETPNGGTTTVSGITADEFIRMRNSDADFRSKFNQAADNRAMTFFDNSANKTYDHLGNTRNEFKSFESTNDSETNEKAYRDTLSPNYDGDQTTIQTTSNKEQPEFDDDGNPVWKKNPDGTFVTDENGNRVQNTTLVRDTVTDTATTSSTDTDVNLKAKSMIDKVSNAVSDAGGFYCAAMKFGNMISMAIAGNEIYQSIRFFMNLAEPLSKVKAGFGNQSPAHEVLNWFSTKANTTVSNFATFDISNDATVGKIGDLVQTGAPLESNGMQMVLARAAPDVNTASSFSLERVDKSITGKLSSHATSSSTAKSCARFDITSNLASIGLTIMSGGLSKIFVGLTSRLVVGTATSFAVSAFFAFLQPTIGQAFFGNAFDNAKGQPGGELFSRGGGAIGSRNGYTNSGYSLAPKTKVGEYNKVTNTVLALDAEVDRNNRSPFDTSSPNTFLGSIAYSLLPTLTSGGFTSISSFLRSTTSSLSTLIGGVHAEGEDSSYMTTFGDCPALEEIGAAGDIYCNPIVIPDSSTADLSPDDQQYQEVIGDATDCNDEGNCTIDPQSDLAKYITYCGGRDSPFGITDQNILGALQPSAQAGPISTVLNQIPFANNIIGIIDSAADLQNMDWATGAKCSQSGGSNVSGLLASTNGDASNREWWNSQGKYYQRYIEDSRILTMMGAYENSKNPVLAYQEAYEEQYRAEHPEADTYIGYLSRVSGLTPENTETVLAFIGYMNYIDQYDPTLRIAMDGNTSTVKTGEEVVADILDQDHSIFFENHNLEQTFTEPVIANHHIVYTDIRNRSFAIC